MIFKYGSLLKIAASSLTFEDIVTEKPSGAQPTAIEQKNAEFLYFRARAISAGDQGPVKDLPNPNGNGDYFPRKELEASYQTFVGRGLFMNHDADHPLKSVGKILDAYAVEDTESGEFYIECLAKIDRKLHPELARKVETGELNTVSMGCSCLASKCSVCGVEIHTDADMKCQHLEAQHILKNYQAEVDMPEYGIVRGAMVPAFSINTGLCFNELSIVNVPADASAFIKTIIASNVQDKASRKTLDAGDKSYIKSILDSLDEPTRKQLKASLLAEAKEETQMADKKPVDAEMDEAVLDALKGMNALQFLRYSEYMERRMAKAAAEKAKAAEPVAEVKEAESVIEKAISKVKDSPLGRLFTNAVKRELEGGKKPEPKKEEKKPEPKKKKSSLAPRAEFNKAEKFLDSTWTLYRGDRVVMTASVGTIWAGDKRIEETKVQDWVQSEEYGNDLIAFYSVNGYNKTAQVLGLLAIEAAKPTADKDVKKTQKAIDKIDPAVVGDKLDDAESKDKKEEKVASIEEPMKTTEVKKTAEPIEETTVVDVPPATDLPPAEETPAVEGVPALDAPATEEAHQSAFDKIDDKLIITENMSASKDKATNEIVVVDAEGKELKRLPDGFGDDVASVLKLLQSVMDVKEEGENKVEDAAPDAVEPAAEEKKEEPKEEEKSEEIPEELMAKRERELIEREAAVKAEAQRVAADRVAASIRARTERCKGVVSAMVAKDMLPMDPIALQAAQATGTPLLDARRLAIEAAVNDKVKQLLAMDDTELSSFEESVKAVRKIASVKKANLDAPLHMEWQPAPREDAELKGIFDSMGSGGGWQ